LAKRKSGWLHVEYIAKFDRNIEALGCIPGFLVVQQTAAGAMGFHQGSISCR
jgi:hypothetical protein